MQAQGIGSFHKLKTLDEAHISKLGFKIIGEMDEEDKPRITNANSYFADVVSFSMNSTERLKGNVLKMIFGNINLVDN